MVPLPSRRSRCLKECEKKSLKKCFTHKQPNILPKNFIVLKQPLILSTILNVATHRGRTKETTFVHLKRLADVKRKWPRESGQAFERRSCGRNTRMPIVLIIVQVDLSIRPQIWANVSCPTPKLLFCSARDNEFLPVFTERAVNAHHFCHRQEAMSKAKS